MRTLTPTLLAAQRTPGSLPSVCARIEDRELRWTCLQDDGGSIWQTAGCATGDALVRARIAAGGALDVQRITDPADGAQWLAWTPLAGDAAPGSDIALSAEAGDSDHLRLFYMRGSGPYSLAWMQSSDGGRTWSAPADYLSGLSSASGSLASAHAQLFYHDPADSRLKLALRSGWDAGDWTVHTWTTAGTLPLRYGLAAGYREGIYYLASCDEEAAGVRRLRVGRYDPSADVWTGPEPIVPPGLPAAAFVPRYPSLCYAGGCWRLSYLETLSGLLAYADPTIIHSADWEHWSFACWVPLDGVEARPVLMPFGANYYLAYERAVWQATAYQPQDPDKVHETAEVVAYTVEEQPWYGYAQVEIYNPDDRYRSLQQTAVRPLARLVLERGYCTAAGEERVARTPYYIISAAIRRGGRRPTLHLECEDGWGLLRRWRPDALYMWSGRSIAWLLAEVLYRAAGLSCRFDGDPAWAMTLDTFALAPSDWDETLPAERRSALARDRRSGLDGESLRGTALGAVRALLERVSGAACWQADGSLYCFVPASQALCDPYRIGAGGEILDALYGCGLIWPTQAHVFGDGVAAQGAAVASRGAPRRYRATGIDPALKTAAACAVRARGLGHAGQARAYGGWVETPCQCGLDLYDLVLIADAHAPLPADQYLRVAGIVEQYEPGRGVFRTRVMIEGA